MGRGASVKMRNHSSVVAGVAAQAQQPAAARLIAGPQSVTELEGPPVPRQDPTAYDEQETVEQDEEHHEAGCIEQLQPQRHSPILPAREGR